MSGPKGRLLLTAHKESVVNTALRAALFQLHFNRPDLLSQPDLIVEFCGFDEGNYLFDYLEHLFKQARVPIVKPFAENGDWSVLRFSDSRLGELWLKLLDRESLPTGLEKSTEAIMLYHGRKTWPAMLTLFFPADQRASYMTPASLLRSILTMVGISFDTKYPAEGWEVCRLVTAKSR